jgi:uncharacterized delta-60 repeat protein
MTSCSTLRALLLVSFGLAATSVSAGGAPEPGDLDATFSGDGWLPVSVTANNDGADIATLPDGRLVFVIAAASTPDLVAVGVSSGDGAASDGNGFILDLGTGPIATVPTALAVQPDGKVVIVGRTGESPSRAFVLRVVVGAAFDVTVDSGFGTSGWTVLSAAQSLRLNDVALDGLGRVVAVGGADLAGGDTDFLVVRLTATGQPDNSFDGDGRRTFAFSAASTFPEEATAVGIDSSNRVVAAGRAATTSAAGGEFAVCRLLETNGGFDNTFSGDGRLLVGFDLGGDDADEADGLALDAQGRILVAGRARDSDGSGHVAALLRLTDIGVLDTDFSTDGRVTSLFGLGGANDSALGKDVLVTREGTVLLLGERLTLDLTSSDLGLSAFDTSGNFDPTYGFLGSRTYNLGGYETLRNATLVAGRVLLMGDQNTAGLVVRLHRDQIFADGFESTDTSEWTLSVP